jgi:hypothetical protein
VVTAVLGEALPAAPAAPAVGRKGCCAHVVCSIEVAVVVRRGVDATVVATAVVGREAVADGPYEAILLRPDTAEVDGVLGAEVTEHVQAGLQLAELFGAHWGPGGGQREGQGKGRQGWKMMAV